MGIDYQIGRNFGLTERAFRLLRWIGHRPEPPGPGQLDQAVWLGVQTFDSQTGRIPGGLRLGPTAAPSCPCWRRRAAARPG
jgi:hypothetical protein